LPAILPRLAEQDLEASLDTMPVVVVSGARQTGKTTLVESMPALRDHLYLTLDDFDVRDQARDRPEELVRRAPKMIIDEVQREPDLLTAIKREVDRQRPRRPKRACR